MIIQHKNEIARIRTAYRRVGLLFDFDIAEALGIDRNDSGRVREIADSLVGANRITRIESPWGVVYSGYCGGRSKTTTLGDLIVRAITIAGRPMRPSDICDAIDARSAAARHLAVSEIGRGLTYGPLIRYDDSPRIILSPEFGFYRDVDYFEQADWLINRVVDERTTIFEIAGGGYGGDWLLNCPVAGGVH